MNIKNKIETKVKNQAKKIVLDINYWLNNYQEVIWLIGNGRSGTTWVSDLINHDNKYREMFEPFHPQLVDGMNFLQLHQYIRSHDINVPLEKAASDVFSGKLTHARVDSDNSSFLYKGLLIKDIYANLFSHWASLRFPQIKIVLLIRNPFSVALSIQNKKSWLWLTDPLELLNQTDLYADYLHPFEDIIRKTSIENDYILCQILIWCIINYVPLRQFEHGQIHICFYEDIFTEPNGEISNIFQFVKPENKNYQANLDKDTIDRPSRVIGSESNLLTKTSPVTSWKNELTSQQIDGGFKILECFGFEELYDDNSMPDRHVLRNIHGKV